MRKLLLIFPILFLILFMGCEQDDINPENTKSEVSSKTNEFTVSYLKTTQITENKELSKQLEKIQPKISTDNKILYIENHDFYIDTDLVVFIENNNSNYHSYTFPLYRKNIEIEGLENILFSVQPDGSYRTFLIKYLLNNNTDSSINDALNNDNVMFTEIDDLTLNNVLNKFQIPTYYTWSEGCLQIFTDFQILWEFCNDSTEGGNNGENSETSNSSGNNGSHNNNNTSNTSGSTDTVHGGSSSSGSIGITKPVINYKKKRLFSFRTLLNNENLAECFNNLSSETQSDVINYLENVTNAPIIADGLNNGVSTSNTFDQNATNQIINILQNGCNNGTPNEELEKKIRIALIENKLADNPYLLLNIPCNQIEKWQEVAQHQIPQSGINKLNQINEDSPQDDWNIQDLEDANGKVVNMDFFPVTISEFPNNPNTGNRYTPVEFFNYFRMNLNILANGSSSNVSFSPSTITGFNETEIWNSSNPLNSIISIRILEDSGSVICSGYNSENQNSGHWYFTTLEVPWTANNDGDGNHPVSGNRKFGYYQDVNGNHVFYVRGVDRFYSSVDSFFSNLLNENEFSGADNLWNTFQENLVEIVDNGGGIANLNTDIIYRPDWNKVREVLNGTRPISDLGCE